jgi:cytochrome b561
MPARGGNARYDTFAMSLHWVIALLIVLDFALALSFGEFNPDDALYLPAAYPLHMSIGACVLLLSLVRVLWRLMNRPPPLPHMGTALRALARLAHLLLYGFMLAVPASGWLVLSLRQQRTGVFGLFSWPWPTLPAIAALGRAEREAWQEALLAWHTRLAYLGMSLLVVHVAAALYHHFARRDDVLRRMLP